MNPSEINGAPGARRIGRGVAFTIFASPVIHGITATATVEVLDREYAEGGGTEPGPGGEIPKN